MTQSRKKKWWKPDFRWWEWPIAVVWTFVEAVVLCGWVMAGVPLVANIQPSVRQYVGLVEVPKDLRDRKAIQEFSATYVEAKTIQKGPFTLHIPAYVRVYVEYSPSAGRVRTKEWIFVRVVLPKDTDPKERTPRLEEVAWMQIFYRNHRDLFVPLASVKVGGRKESPKIIARASDGPSHGVLFKPRGRR